MPGDEAWLIGGYHNLDSMGLNVKSEADQSGKILPGGSSWRAMGDEMQKRWPLPGMYGYQ